MMHGAVCEALDTHPSRRRVPHHSYSPLHLFVCHVPVVMCACPFTPAPLATAFTRDTSHNISPCASIAFCRQVAYTLASHSRVTYHFHFPLHLFVCTALPLRSM